MRAQKARRRARTGFLLAVLLSFIGCTTTVSPPLPTQPGKQWDAGELIRSLTERDKQLRTLRSLARVDYAGPKGKNGFQEAVLVERAHRLRLETLSFLGAVLIVTVNDKEIAGYHPREGVYVRGPRSKANLLRYTQIPLELGEMTALLMGLPPVEAAAGKLDGPALVFARDGRKTDAVSFGLQEPLPTQWERFNAAGAVELKAQFSDYVSTPAGAFPTKVVMEAPLQKKKLQIQYQDPELNAAIPAELFSQEKPANAKELPIEAIGCSEC